MLLLAAIRSLLLRKVFTAVFAAFMATSVPLMAIATPVLGPYLDAWLEYWLYGSQYSLYAPIRPNIYMITLGISSSIGVATIVTGAAMVGAGVGMHLALPFRPLFLKDSPPPTSSG